MNKERIVSLHLQIKAKRKEKNMSQMQLAKTSSLSMTCIQKLEAGRNTNISLETLRMISQALEFYDWDLNLKK